MRPRSCLLTVMMMMELTLISTATDWSFLYAYITTGWRLFFFLFKTFPDRLRDFSALVPVANRDSRSAFYIDSLKIETEMYTHNSSSSFSVFVCWPPPAHAGSNMAARSARHTWTHHQTTNNKHLVVVCCWVKTRFGNGLHHRHFSMNFSSNQFQISSFFSFIFWRA